MFPIAEWFGNRKFAAGRLENPDRAPAGHLQGAIGTPAHRTEPVRLPVGARPAPCRHPYRRLAFHSTNFLRAPQGRRRICDHTCRRNKNRTVPVRSLNPRQDAGQEKSYGARFICDLGISSSKCRLYNAVPKDISVSGIESRYLRFKSRA